MRLKVRQGLSRLTGLGLLLLLLRDLTDTVTASTVNVTCDSYGVEVEWKSAGLAENQEFQIELIRFGKENGNDTSVIRPHGSISRYNISKYIQKPSFNRYYVKVMAWDNEKWKLIGESLIFSYNIYLPADIYCNLSFPEVEVFPKDGDLVVRFINPLRLYENATALREVSPDDTLGYTIYDVNNKEEFSDSCPSERNVCEKRLSFPEERWDYCFFLSGMIRQTYIQEKHFCYSGRIKPGPLIPVLVTLAVLSIVCLAVASLALCIDRKLTKENLAKIPHFLSWPLPQSHLSKPLTAEPEHVEKNPHVELVLEPPCDDDSENTALLEVAPFDDSSGDSFGRRGTEETANTELDGSRCRDSCSCCDESDMTSGGLSEGGYEPRTIEMSEGDFVTPYGT